MKSTVYLETTIPSYLTARPSRDLIKAAHQELTLEWWETRDRFDVFISQLVIREASGGDPGAAARRLDVLEGLPVLRNTAEASRLAKALLTELPLPAKAGIDALHMAIAAVHEMDYLLTWNCRHIANAMLRKGIEDVCRTHDFRPPILCTPNEMMEQ